MRYHAPLLLFLAISLFSSTAMAALPVFAHHPTTDSSLVIDSKGELHVWGRGTGNVKPTILPRPAGVSSWTAISAGAGWNSLFYVALSSNGVLYGNGANNYG